ncbi:50S ribosomal protein L33 [Candidatus Karelsulcia muelleri]
MVFISRLFIRTFHTMRKKAKLKRIQIILECLEQENNGRSRYFTTKNRINTSRKLKLRKFNPFLNRVTLHKEI